MNNLIKRLIMSLTVVGTLTSANAMAETYYDYAKVKKARPVFHYVTISEPVEQCYNVRYRTRRHHDGAPTVAGAIIGGVIGNAIGDNRASTVAGAIIGGSLGHSASHRAHRVERRCEIVHENTRKVKKLKGYKVKYRYNGDTYHTFMRKHPGDKIKVRVKVSPTHYEY